MEYLSIDEVHGTIDGMCYHYDRACARESALSLITIPQHLQWAHAKGLRPCAICTPRNRDDWNPGILTNDHHPLIEEAQHKQHPIQEIGGDSSESYDPYHTRRGYRTMG